MYVHTQVVFISFKDFTFFYNKWFGKFLNNINLNRYTKLLLFINMFIKLYICAWDNYGIVRLANKKSFEINSTLHNCVI